MYNIIAQAIGILAMGFNILSYQGKKANSVILMQFFGTFFFAINFFLLGAYMGGLLNLIGMIRAALFLKKEKFKTDNKIWFFVFCTIFVICYILVFTVFKKEPTFLNFLIEILPVVGMVATTMAYRNEKAKIIRRYGFVSSVSWLIYNIVAVAIGAILCEVFSIISIIIGMIRLDYKK